MLRAMNGSLKGSIPSMDARRKTLPSARLPRPGCMH